MKNIKIWRVAILVVVAAISVQLISNRLKQPWLSCPHMKVTETFPRPYPNVKAPYGIEVYMCKNSDFFVVREYGKYY